MSPDVVNFISIFSGICGIIAFVLYFVTLPKSQRTISLLVTSTFIGLPVSLLLVKENIFIFSGAIIIYTVSIIIFSFLYGKTKSQQKPPLPDLHMITNKRPVGHDWIFENVFKIKNGPIQIDAFGVKLDALYKVIKGVGYTSKLPHDVDINMRVLVLQPNCFGVQSRASIERNNKVVKDVELMKDIWIKLVKEYKRHPSHNLTVKMYDFMPSFYILRVNDQMLVGTYLAESGYENLSIHLAKNDGKTFQQFDRFFERVWTDCSKNILSKIL